MILELAFLNQIITTGCPDGVLVFDGDVWTSPRTGGRAALSYEGPVSKAPGRTFPVDEVTLPKDYTMKCTYICNILSVTLGNVPTVPQGVVSAPDPLGGGHLCLICNQGNQLLNVKVKT